MYPLLAPRAYERHHIQEDWIATTWSDFVTNPTVMPHSALMFPIDPVYKRRIYTSPLVFCLPSDRKCGMPNQLMAARDLPDAARVAMRIAVNSDNPKPLLYAAQLLIDACLAAFTDNAAWKDAPAVSRPGR